MEIHDIKISGKKAFVIFTGAQYIFKDNFCGIFAVADRSQETGPAANGTEKFSLSVGNEYAPAVNKTVISFAKRYIKDQENRFVKTAVSFDVKTAKLKNFGLNVSVYEIK